MPPTIHMNFTGIWQNGLFLIHNFLFGSFSLVSWLKIVNLAYFFLKITFSLGDDYLNYFIPFQLSNFSPDLNYFISSTNFGFGLFLFFQVYNMLCKLFI